jgi:acyl dehydratase
MSAGTAASLALAGPGASFVLVKPAVTTAQLVRYAGASDDYNPIHYDLPYAQAAGLGGVIAHGLLTMAFMGQAVTDWAGAHALVRRLAARFSTPVRPGDSVKVTVTVTDKRVDESGATFDCTLLATVDERTVAAGEASIHVASVRCADVHTRR